jgi:hypothetical protein
MSDIPFVINQVPTQSGGVIQLRGGPIFTRMNVIKIADNGSDPTEGDLYTGAQIGTILATTTEYNQVWNTVSGMQSGQTRTLDITCDASGNPVHVTGVQASGGGLSLRQNGVANLDSTAKHAHSALQQDDASAIVAELRKMDQTIRDGFDRLSKQSDINELKPSINKLKTGTDSE